MGEDVNIKPQKKKQKQWTACESFDFSFHHFASFTLFLPPLHQTDFYHWESSLSVSQGYLNTKITLKKERLSTQGDWNRSPVELPIISIWKQNPCKPSHHENHSPWWENCQVFWGCNLDHTNKMCLCLQVTLVWKLEEWHSINLPHWISTTFPTSGGRNLVGGLSQEGKWYFSLGEKNNSKFTVLESWFRKNKPREGMPFIYSQSTYIFSEWFASLVLECLWLRGKDLTCIPVRLVDVRLSCPLLQFFFMGFLAPVDFRKKGNGFPDSTLLPNQPYIIQILRLELR